MARSAPPCTARIRDVFEISRVQLDAPFPAHSNRRRPHPSTLASISALHSSKQTFTLCRFSANMADGCAKACQPSLLRRSPLSTLQHLHAAPSPQPTLNGTTTAAGASLARESASTLLTVPFLRGQDKQGKRGWSSDGRGEVLTVAWVRGCVGGCCPGSGS